MGAIVTCDACKKTYRYSSNEINNNGTFWHPIREVLCKNCGSIIREEGEKSSEKIPGKFPDNYQISSSSEGGFKLEKTERKGTGEERARKSDIREYWIQLYLKENYEKLGFSQLDGPFSVGPDFRGIYAKDDLPITGQEIDIEVERDCGNYILHGHHKSPKFKNCKLLVVLNPSQPNDDIIDHLPDYIMTLDIPDFVSWWQPKAQEYGRKSAIKGIFIILEDVLQSKFSEYCPDKNRELSICPACNQCAYNDEGDNVPRGSELTRYVLYFLSIYKYEISSADFSITDIDANELNKFVAMIVG